MQLTLLEALEKRQVAEGLSHTAFAAKIGISEVMWRQLRRKRRRTGRATLRGIVRAYPDLEGYVMLFLTGDSQHVPSGGRMGRSRHTEESLPAHVA